MSSVVRIQPVSDELIPGQTTRIPVILAISEPLKVRGVHATFHGAEETEATYTTYNSATKSTQTHTAVEHVDIVKTEYLLSGTERKGFFGNIADGFSTLFGGGEHDVLQPGEYPFEVDVQVPPDGRPSFAGQKCRVFYELSVLLDIPLGRDIKQTQSFRVADRSLSEPSPPQPVRVRYPEDQARGLFESWFSPEIRVEAALSQDVFREGDTIEGIFVLNTPEPLEYRAIDVRLLAVEKTAAHGHEDSYSHVGEPVRIATRGVMEGGHSQRFQLPASLPGPPTTQGRLFSIDCFVQIELDVPWAKDPRIRVPVALLGSGKQPDR
jgi:Arrestin (or S-antigen), N-terminal domain